LSLELKRDRLLIEVADDGCGFDLDGNIAIGNGLENMQKRLKTIGGKLESESEPGCGTTIRLQVPLEKRSLVA
jgi:signal transduction histidine kinase